MECRRYGFGGVHAVAAFKHPLIPTDAEEEGPISMDGIRGTDANLSHHIQIFNR